MQHLSTLRFYSFNYNGKPNEAGFLFAYQAGSDIPQLTYQDYLGFVPNSNPIQLGVDGSARVYLKPTAYRFVVKDKLGVTLHVEEIAATGTEGGTTTNFETYDELRASTTTTDVAIVLGRSEKGDAGAGIFIKTTESLSDDDGVVLINASGDIYKRTGVVFLDPKWFGLEYASLVDQTTALNKALQASSTLNLPVQVAGNVRLSQNITTPVNSNIIFEDGSSISSLAGALIITFIGKVTPAKNVFTQLITPIFNEFTVDSIRTSWYDTEFTSSSIMPKIFQNTIKYELIIDSIITLDSDFVVSSSITATFVGAGILKIIGGAPRSVIIPTITEPTRKILDVLGGNTALVGSILIGQGFVSPSWFGDSGSNIGIYCALKHGRVILSTTWELTSDITTGDIILIGQGNKPGQYADETTDMLTVGANITCSGLRTSNASIKIDPLFTITTDSPITIEDSYILVLGVSNAWLEIIGTQGYTKLSNSIFYTKRKINSVNYVDIVDCEFLGEYKSNPNEYTEFPVQVIRECRRNKFRWYKAQLSENSYFFSTLQDSEFYLYGEGSLNLNNGNVIEGCTISLASVSEVFNIMNGQNALIKDSYITATSPLIYTLDAVDVAFSNCTLRFLDPNQAFSNGYANIKMDNCVNDDGTKFKYRSGISYYDGYTLDESMIAISATNAPNPGNYYLSTSARDNSGSINFSHGWYAETANSGGVNNIEIVDNEYVRFITSANAPTAFSNICARYICSPTNQALSAIFNGGGDFILEYETPVGTDITSNSYMELWIGRPEFYCPNAPGIKYPNQSWMYNIGKSIRISKLNQVKGKIRAVEFSKWNPTRIDDIIPGFENQGSYTVNIYGDVACVRHVKSWENWMEYYIIVRPVNMPALTKFKLSYRPCFPRNKELYENVFELNNTFKRDSVSTFTILDTTYENSSYMINNDLPTPEKKRGTYTTTTWNIP